MERAGTADRGDAEPGDELVSQVARRPDRLYALLALACSRSSSFSGC